MFMIAYENSEKSATAYYNEGGFPWWSYDRTENGTKYESREKAEKVASQLRSQRARAGNITVVEALIPA